MYGSDQAVSIVLDVENDESAYVVCVWETRTQFHEILPTCQFYNFSPGPDLFRSFRKFLRRLLQALDRDNVHSLSLLRKLLRVKPVS